MIKSSIWRIAFVLVLAAGGAPVFAQSSGAESQSDSAPAPLNNTRQFLSSLPKGTKPHPGNGELLLLKSAGAPQVVRLYCSVDPYAFVMLPTGEIDLVEKKKTKPTTNPFVAASAAEIKKSLKANGFEKFKVEEGKFYLYVYDCSDTFFEHAKLIMDTMLPGVVDNLKSWGMKVKRPEMPMVVVIMPNRKAFDAVHRMPKEVAAYYDAMTNRIMMYEDLELYDAAPEFAAKQAGYVVAHEGVHQLLANVGIDNRMSNWPHWIREGIAEYYCPLKVTSKLIHNANSDLPERVMKWSKAGMVNDLRMYALLKMNSNSGNLLKKTVEAEQLDSNGYALAWGLVHYLANKKPEKFRAYLADVSQYQPLDEATMPAPGKADALFVKHFGSDYEAIERELQKYLTSKTMQAEYVDPIENQTHYLVKSVEKVGRAFQIKAVVRMSPVQAKKWKEEEEAEHPKATFNTIICKSRTEAERQLQKIKH